MFAEPLSGDPWRKERILVVAPQSISSAIVADVRRRYPECAVSTSDTYLSGIADAMRAPVRAALVCVDPRSNRLVRAVRGLRRAVGEKARLILCCVPETEPLARKAMTGGADDYILHPLHPNELDEAFNLSPQDAPTAAPPANEPPAASMVELAQLGEILANLNDSPTALLERIAALLRVALDASGVSVTVEGTVVFSGEPPRKPVLTVSLAGVVGSMAIGERARGAYTPSDAAKLQHYASVIGHVLQAAAKQRRWKKLASTDDGSGLPNRRYLRERLAQILVEATRERKPVTLLLFDLDDFKSYNDTYGHDVGDAIIKGAGELFRRCCREHDVVARYGGDEFAVVFWDPQGPRTPGSRHPECAMTVLERFREALKTQTFPGLGVSGQGQLTISGGLATFPWNAGTIDELITRADEALLAAKRAGKNRIMLVGEAGDGSAM